jgi:hypothetical protein
VSGSTGSATGFNFTAPALMLDGQNVAGTFNFDLPVVAANSTTQSFNFVNNAANSAYQFLGGAIDVTDQATYGLMGEQTNYLSQIGNLFGQAANTAAGKISSGGGGLFGFLGI